MTSKGVANRLDDYAAYMVAAMANHKETEFHSKLYAAAERGDPMLIYEVDVVAREPQSELEKEVAGR